MSLPNDERESVFEERRIDMVRSQIERRGVRAPAVLDAMRRVPRHQFIPERLWSEAYNDYPLPIGGDQTISQPYIVAYMTELLEIGPGDKVLEIGAGSGYQAAILAELGCEIFSVEIIDSLADEARARLEELGYANVHVINANGHFGWPAEAPYEGIIGTAAPAEVPPALVDQLKVGGRLVMPVGEFSQDLHVIERTATGTRERTTIPVRFVPMTGEKQ